MQLQYVFECTTICSWIALSKVCIYSTENVVPLFAFLLTKGWAYIQSNSTEKVKSNMLLSTSLVTKSLIRCNILENNQYIHHIWSWSSDLCFFFFGSCCDS